MRMNKSQSGGSDPLNKVPKFKYTSSEERKLFVGTLYPYADHLIKCVHTIPYSSYSYDGECEYILEDIDNKYMRKDGTSQSKQVIQSCKSTSNAFMYFMGGTVYELLNKKITNVNMHDYCDATGDIDVQVSPPSLTYYEGSDVRFFTVDNVINSFYKDFTNFIFNHLVKNLTAEQNIFNNIDSIVDFDINEYDEIPNAHKTPEFGYRVVKIGKFYVVAFVSHARDMFKFQVIYRIEENDISITDHALELIIVITNDYTIFPSSGARVIKKVNTLTINSNTYNIDNYDTLIRSNVNAYVERSNYIYSYPDVEKYKVIHKSINHVARLFYLYELFYKNRDILNTKDTHSLLFNFTNNYDYDINTFKYYKIVNSIFYEIEVDVKYFLNAYYELVYNYRNLNSIMTIYMRRKHIKTYFEITDKDQLGLLHDTFVDKLFNNDLFEPTRLLTYDAVEPSPIQSKGGAIKKRTNNTKRKNMKRKNTKRKNTKRYR